MKFLYLFVPFICLVAFFLFYQFKENSSVSKALVVEDWGVGKVITPKNETDFKNNWLSRGQWKIDGDRLVTQGEIPSNQILLFKTPVTGSVAFEFKARVLDQESLKSGGDLSVILLSDKNLKRRYDLQVVASNEPQKDHAIIQMIDIPLAAQKINLEVGKEYLIRGESDGDSIRLYVDSKLILETYNKYFLNGAFHGIYSYGEGKEFWDIKVYRKNKRFYADPLKLADLKFASALSYPTKDNDFYHQARAAYSDLLKEATGDKMKALLYLRLAQLEQEMQDYNKMGEYIEKYFLIESSYKGQLLKMEFFFLSDKPKEALSQMMVCIENYPKKHVETAGSVKKILNSTVGKKLSKSMKTTLWKTCLDYGKSDEIIAIEQNIESIEFLKGRSFANYQLRGNQIQDIRPLGRLASNIDLSIGYNQISDVSVLDFDSINSLNLNDNPILDISVLKGKSIKKLDLSRIKSEDLSAVSEILGLEVLFINGLVLKDNGSFLSKLSLKALNCKSVGLGSLAMINKDKLEFLDCSHNEVEKITGSDFKKLKKLIINNNKLTSLEELSKIPLDFLSVDGNPLKSLAPYYKNPPKIFNFDCSLIDNSELVKVIELWKGNLEFKNPLQMAKVYLTLRKSNYSAQDLKKIATTSSDGHKYLYIPMEMTHAEAENFCKNLGGYLVTITSKKEDLFLNTLPGFYSNVWIGLSKKNKNKVWANGQNYYYGRFNVDTTNEDERDATYFRPYEMKSYWKPSYVKDHKSAFLIEWDK